MRIPRTVLFKSLCSRPVLCLSDTEKTNCKKNFKKRFGRISANRTVNVHRHRQCMFADEIGQNFFFNHLTV